MSDLLKIVDAFDRFNGTSVEGVDTVSKALGEFGKALAQVPGDLTSILNNFSILEVDAGIISDPSVQAGIAALQTSGAELGSASETLITPRSPPDNLALATDLADYFVKLGDFLKDAKDFANSIKAIVQSGVSVELENVIEQLPEYLIAYVVEKYLNDNLVYIPQTLRYFGILEPTANFFGANARFRLDNLKELLRDPLPYIEAQVKWGQPDFDATELVFDTIKAISLFTDRNLADTFIVLDGKPAFSFGCVTLVTEDTSPPRVRFEKIEDLTTSRNSTISLGAGWNAVIDADANLPGPFGAAIEAPFEIIPLGLDSKPNAHLNIELQRTVKGGSSRMNLFGAGTLVSLTTEKMPIGVRSSLTGGTSPTIDFKAFAGFKGAEFSVDGSNADGFVGSILQSVKIKAPFDINFAISPENGLHVEGSGGFEIILPAHFNLGPVEVKKTILKLVSTSDQDTNAKLETSTELTGNLGPLKVSLDRIGAKFLITLDGDMEGTSVPRMQPEFQPPLGAGLSIDAEVVKGGGFISHDPDTGRYSGALELMIAEKISVKAIGIVDTKLPGGAQGFALIILISSEFPPVQLGFGFTLNGVGGLLSINRSADTESLREGVKGGAVSSILFPQNPVASAPQIIRDLDGFFPIDPGRFAVGPMFKLGWGTPTLVDIEIGIILDLPAPFTILLPGTVKIGLPSADNKIIRFNIAFLGAWEQDKKAITFFASLYDSKVTSFTISGDAAFAMIYGSNAFFLNSIGGFHPRYVPPPTPTRIPNLNRLMVSFLTGNPSASLAGYFAVTSNTVQFGGRAVISASVWKFSVYGEVGFDVLIIFNPFSFNAALYAKFAVKFGSKSIASVSISFTFKGPRPYNLKGRAKLKIAFASKTLKINKTWGGGPPPPLPKIDILPLIAHAIEDPRSWEIVDTRRGHPAITFKQPADASQELLLPPDGRLAFRQKEVPLDRQIDRFGFQRPGDGKIFRIKSVIVAGVLSSETEIKDEFAPAQYYDISDAEKLSRKSFESFPSGAVIRETTTSDHIGSIKTRAIKSEIEVVEPQHPRLISLAAILTKLFTTFASRPALLLKQARAISAQPGLIQTEAEPFSVTSASSLAAGDAVSFDTQTDAILASRASTGTSRVRHAITEGELVVPQAELAA